MRLQNEVNPKFGYSPRRIATSRPLYKEKRSTSNCNRSYSSNSINNDAMSKLNSLNSKGSTTVYVGNCNQLNVDNYIANII